MAASTRMAATNPQATINHFRSVKTGARSRKIGHVFHPTHTTEATHTKTNQESETMESGGAVPHADVHQVISVASKAKEGVVICVASDNTVYAVSATGPIVPHGGEPNPKGVETAYIHFHPYGKIVSGQPGKFLLVPTMRPENAVNNEYECPVRASTVRVLCANRSSSTIEVKEVNLADPGSVSDTDILWLMGSVSGNLRRLYVTPDDVRKLYMAADAKGSMFLTEDEPNQPPMKGQENPQTYLHFYWKYQVVEKH